MKSGSCVLGVDGVFMVSPGSGWSVYGFTWQFYISYGSRLQCLNIILWDYTIITALVSGIFCNWPFITGPLIGCKHSDQQASWDSSSDLLSMRQLLPGFSRGIMEHFEVRPSFSKGSPERCKAPTTYGTSAHAIYPTTNVKYFDFLV